MINFIYDVTVLISNQLVFEILQFDHFTSIN